MHLNHIKIHLVSNNPVLPTENVLVLDKKDRLINGKLTQTIHYGIACIDKHNSNSAEFVNTFILESDLIAYMNDPMNL